MHAAGTVNHREAGLLRLIDILLDRLTADIDADRNNICSALLDRCCSSLRTGSCFITVADAVSTGLIQLPVLEAAGNVGIVTQVSTVTGLRLHIGGGEAVRDQDDELVFRIGNSQHILRLLQAALNVGKAFIPICIRVIVVGHGQTVDLIHHHSAGIRQLNLHLRIGIEGDQAQPPLGAQIRVRIVMLHESGSRSSGPLKPGRFRAVARDIAIIIGFLIRIIIHGIGHVQHQHHVGGSLIDNILVRYR